MKATALEEVMDIVTPAGKEKCETGIPVPRTVDIKLVKFKYKFKSVKPDLRVTQGVFEITGFCIQDSA